MDGAHVAAAQSRQRDRVARAARGSLSKQLIARFDLAQGLGPPTFGLGFKELWQLPPGRVQPGRIEHYFGRPLDARTYGGSFLYHLDQDRVYVGYVVGLDYRDPRLQPFEAFQQFKHHPRIGPLLHGGEILSAGARAIAAGGYQSLPRPEMPGALLIGDAAGTLNVFKINGIHQAIRSGMLAAEHLHERGRGAGLEILTGGRTPWTLSHTGDAPALAKLDEYVSPDRGWVTRTLPPRDRVSSVFFAGNVHDENQPVHLHVADTSICVDRCAREFGNPCQNFCPAAVYEILDDGAGGRRRQINATNCVRCKACDIKDPYGIITWTAPGGGSGPELPESLSLAPS